MALDRLRRWSRVIAVVLLVAAIRLPHAAVDDAACMPAAIPSYGDHDESQHSLQPGPGSQAESEHCAVCHWTRSLRSPRTLLNLGVAELSPPSIVLRLDRAEVLPAVVDNLPARAPPADLL
jgi:hypothetical protein